MPNRYRGGYIRHPIFSSESIPPVVSSRPYLRTAGSSRCVGQGTDFILILRLDHQIVPSLVSVLAVIFKTLADHVVELPAQFALGGIGVLVHDPPNGWVEPVQKVDVFPVNDNEVNLSMVENVVDILVLQAVVDSDVDSTGGGDTEEAFEEGGGVWAEDSDYGSYQHMSVSSPHIPVS